MASGECEGLTYDSKEEKAAFFVEAHALMGTELKMKMKDHIVKQQIKHSSWNFKGNGHWLDEQGLEDKYKNHKDKDFIIKNIKDHANTMTHPSKKNDALGGRRLPKHARNRREKGRQAGGRSAQWHNASTMTP